ncbi:MAG: sugar ABC transporter permease, partial [Pygmaiobacter sp.]
DTRFWSVAVKNSALITFLGGAIIFGIAFLLCSVLSSKVKGKKFFRALIFFPAVINPIAIAVLWTFIYNNKWGLLNNFLALVGLESWQKAWMDPSILFWAILVAMVWMYSGFYCVILLAALDRVPQSHIEAAMLEGAGEFTIFFKIKIPMIWDVLTTALTLWCINSVKEFALLYAWGGGVDIPSDGATNMAVQMYITAFGKRVTIYRMGYATAMGVLMFLAVAVLVVTISVFMKRDKLEY